MFFVEVKRMLVSKATNKTLMLRILAGALLQAMWQVLASAHAHCPNWCPLILIATNLQLHYSD